MTSPGAGFANGILTALNADFSQSVPIGATGNVLLTDGQIWIGSTTANSGGTHVNVVKITPGTGITITQTATTFTIGSSGSTTDYHDSRYIVSAGGVTDGANYTTIASAYSAAVASGSPQTVFVQPGTYTENLTLSANIDIKASQDGDTPTVTIVGNLTGTFSGTCTISGVRLQTNSTAFLTVSGNSATNIILNRCYLNCSNNTGIIYSSSSSSSGITIFYCRGNISTTGISLFTSTGSGGINFEYTNITNTGASSTASTTSTSPVSIQWCSFAFPLSTSSTGMFGLFNSYFDTSTINTASLTTAGTGGSNALNSYFSSGSASSISIGSGSSLTINNSQINSSNSSAISGSGSLSFGSLSFLSSSLIATTTQSPYIISNDALKIKSPGAYPYTTIPQDAVILVDTSSARTIVPLASPTTGQKHIIKDSVGSAAANNITITPSGKNIDGAASSIINVAYGAVEIVYNGSEWSIV